MVVRTAALRTHKATSTPAKAPKAPAAGKSSASQARIQPVAERAINPVKPQQAPTVSLPSKRVSNTSQERSLAHPAPAPKAKSKEVTAPASPHYKMEATPAKTKRKTEQKKELTETERTLHANVPVIKAPKNKSTSFLSKVTRPKNLCLIGAVVALKTAFTVLAVKIGPLAATHLVAQQTVAFLSPGVYVAGLALEVALKTATTIIVHGMLPIVLPILSTIVVTTLAVGLTVYVGYLIMIAMQNKIKATLDKVPLVGDTIKSMLFSEEQAEGAKAQPKVQTWGSYLTSFLPGSNADDVEGSDDGEDSDDDSDIEEAPRVYESAVALATASTKLSSTADRALIFETDRAKLMPDDTHKKAAVSKQKKSGNATGGLEVLFEQRNPFVMGRSFSPKV